MTAARAFLLDGFDDPALDTGRWDDLLRHGDTNVVYLTERWQRAWWDVLGPGQLLLVAGERAGHIVTLAPLYAEAGVLFFVGTGDADYMDFVGDVGDPEVLDAILDVAARAAGDFCGFRLFGVLESSRTGARLQEAAARLGWWCWGQDRSAAPRIDLITGRARALAAANGRRVSKRERYFCGRGSLQVRELDRPDDIRGRLDTFFEQHVARWDAAGVKSSFADTAHRRFFDEVTRRTGETGWPRLTCLDWQDRPIACEYGWVYMDTYYSGPSCFALDLASRSPGQVLQRRIVLAAIRDGLAAFDFGSGDFPYKLMYATAIRNVDTWNLCPPSAARRTEKAAC